MVLMIAGIILGTHDDARAQPYDQLACYKAKDVKAFSSA